MLHGKKSSYLEDKLVQNSKNPIELRKISKSLCLDAKEGNKVNFSPNKDGTIQSEPHENANIFKRFFSELAKNLAEKLPITPYKYNNGTTKDYYTDVSRMFYLTKSSTNICSIPLHLLLMVAFDFSTSYVSYMIKKRLCKVNRHFYDM